MCRRWGGGDDSVGTYRLGSVFGDEEGGSWLVTAVIDDDGGDGGR